MPDYNLENPLLSLFYLDVKEHKLSCLSIGQEGHNLKTIVVNVFELNETKIEL